MREINNNVTRTRNETIQFKTRNQNNFRKYSNYTFVIGSKLQRSIAKRLKKKFGCLQNELILVFLMTLVRRFCMEIHKVTKSFFTKGLFLYLLKMSLKQRFSDTFRGYGKRPLAWNGLKGLITKISIRRRQIIPNKSQHSLLLMLNKNVRESVVLWVHYGCMPYR